MKPSKDQTLWAGDYPDGSPDGRPLTGGGPRAFAPGLFAGDAIPMTMFVNLLAGPLNRPVINKTGLTGRYDIDLHYAPGSGQVPSVETVESAQSDSPTEASLFTAIQEQLGLKLEARKAPLDILVIKHIEQPPEN